MGRAPREITDTELSLLNELWQRPSATVPELTEALYGNNQPALLATVRKLLDRLEAKGCVSRDRSRWPHHYIAAVKREELASNRLQATADEFFDGDLAPLLTHLVRSQKLTAKDREELRKLFDELDRKDTGKSK
ncbi:MAG TPA: BlaI/MecI/CopY family transcriptional regulator [Gemmataceae bacterium]|nr:BlaI/MecI/CopY family transcriptional regulator [Gemmataceae bacterium]